MKECNRKIINAVIQRAEVVCPDSLLLIGLYGSASTGDLHEKSDLDLMILIRDERGRSLATSFLLDDVGIGYDLYCTTWPMLERDAECNHAHLSKLLDSSIIYVKDASAVAQLELLRAKARATLDSDARYHKAQAAFNEAKLHFSDCLLADSLSQARATAGITLYFLFDALMLFHGKYFQKGVKRTLEELRALSLPFDVEESVMTVICTETLSTLHHALTDFMKQVAVVLAHPSEKEAPSPENLTGTYEEMFSNWRNKMYEAADRNDRFSSFFNMGSFQFMLREIADSVEIEALDSFEHFVPHSPEQNAQAFDVTLARYLDEYRKAGISPKHFANVDAFLAEYGISGKSNSEILSQNEK